MQKQEFTSDNNEVFLVTYSLKLEKKIFYKFFGSKYEVDNCKFLFTEAKVPISIPTAGGIVHIGQSIEPPELDAKSLAIFILRMEKPAWYDKDETSIDSYIDLDPADSQNDTFDTVTKALYDTMEDDS